MLCRVAISRMLNPDDIFLLVIWSVVSLSPRESVPIQQGVSSSQLCLQFRILLPNSGGSVYGFQNSNS